MKNYIKQLIDLFGQNDYSADTQKKSAAMAGR